MSVKNYDSFASPSGKKEGKSKRRKRGKEAGREEGEEGIKNS